MAERREATTHGEGIPGVDAEGAPREDDRNEQVAGSPAPDPTEEVGDAGEVPEAD